MQSAVLATIDSVSDRLTFCHTPVSIHVKTTPATIMRSSLDEIPKGTEWGGKNQ